MSDDDQPLLDEAEMAAAASEFISAYGFGDQAVHAYEEFRRERIAWLRRQEALAVSRRGPGLLPGEPPAPVWVSILSDQEPDDDGKIFCVNPNHDDRGKPNMHVYHDHVWCYKCGLGGKSFAFAAMVLGIGEQRDDKWRAEEPGRSEVNELLRNLGLKPPLPEVGAKE